MTQPTIANGCGAASLCNVVETCQVFRLMLRELNDIENNRESMY